MRSLDQTPSDQSEARTASHEDIRGYEREKEAENHLKRQSEWLQVTSIYCA